jgi:hypothetical protein
MCLTHPVNFPCGRKPEYPEKTHDFRQSVDFLLFFTLGLGSSRIEKFQLRLEPATLEVKGKCANHLATEAPDKGLATSRNTAIEIWQPACLPVFGSN